MTSPIIPLIRQLNVDIQPTKGLFRLALILSASIMTAQIWANSNDSYDSEGVTMQFRSLHPFISNYSLGTIEIVSSKPPKNRNTFVITSNYKMVPGYTNLRRTWTWHIRDNFQPSFQFKTNFVLPPALLDLLEKEKKRLQSDNESLQLTLARLPAQNLGKVILYSSAKFLADIRPSDITSVDDILSIKEKLTYISNLQAGTKTGRVLSLPGYHKFYYPSSITKKEHFFEILNSSLPRPINISAKGSTSRYMKAIYYLGDNEVNLKNALPKYFNPTGFEVILKNSFINGSGTFSLENKKLFEEFRGIIEASLPIRKEAIYLVSPEESLAALKYFSYSPTRYAAMGLLEYSGTIAPMDLTDLNSRLEGISKPPLLFLNKADETKNQNFIQTYTNGLTRENVSRVLSNVNFSTKSAPYSTTNLAETFPYFSRYFEGKELSPAPTSIKYSVKDPDFGGTRHYLSIEKLSDTKVPGKIEFNFLAGNVSISNINIDSFSIDLTYPMFQNSDLVIITINGKMAFAENVKGFSSVIFNNEGRTYFFK